jgi:hypothetical protein
VITVITFSEDPQVKINFRERSQQHKVG